MHSTEGYLKLFVTKESYSSKQHMVIDENEVSILSGIYISPFAKSIFEDNEEIADGLLMDTTWRVLPYYVTSILMISMCNVGIPVAFSFGNSETIDLYELFFSVMKEKIDVDLSSRVVESDKGVALAAVCSKHNCKHLGCLRHFLVSIGTKPYSQQIGELVSCKCQLDFDVLCDIYSKSFAEYIDTDEFADLQKTLKKAGLSYNAEKQQIEITNADV